jgi:hypothetical protein
MMHERKLIGLTGASAAVILSTLVACRGDVASSDAGDADAADAAPLDAGVPVVVDAEAADDASDLDVDATDTSDAEVAQGDADDGTCSYPSGPYDLREEATVPAMAWPDAVPGVDEVGSAELALLRCEPGVHSIFVQAVARSCSECPARLRQISDLREHWATYGVKWMFIVDDVFSGSALANEYIERYGITFGYRTSDADNTYGERAIAGSTLYRSVPWTGVIRASDMVLVHDEPDDEYLDIVTIAVEMAGE